MLNASSRPPLQPSSLIIPHILINTKADSDLIKVQAERAHT